ncbi:MAG: hypothetical protein Q9183_003087 [Haloplaca sp. 2 TL-2023]
MTSRRLPLLHDRVKGHRSWILNNTLGDILPEESSPKHYSQGSLPRGHHLVYFPPFTRLPELLSDGTDTLHSPGPPFNRRMWAGGEIWFHPRRVKYTNRSLKCSESITDVEVKGKEGEEKVFVNVRRNFQYEDVPRGYDASTQFILEDRKLVFMRDSPRPPAEPPSPAPPRSVVNPPHAPNYYHTLTPSRALLFRFSALTFNAHAIHLDKQYCQSIEGHRNLLVHGPLSVILMLQVLQGYHSRKLKNEGKEQEVVTHMDYRCLAPLYAEEELKVCLRQKDDSTWETWIEGPDGGLAVRGTVTMSPRPSKKGQEAKTAKGVEEIPTTAEEGALG